MNADDIRSSFEAAGQGQVFRFWDTLDAAGRDQLLAQAAQVDLAEVQGLVDTLVKGDGEAPMDYDQLEPAPYEAFPEHGGDTDGWIAAYAEGERALRAGKVAAFVVAGGQGSRLGYDGPKGTFPVTPVKEKPLFQVFAEKIRAAEALFDCRIPWLVMTSRINHEATVDFFKEHAFFGLRPDQVDFFSQGLMPAVDAEGNILLSAPDSLAMSPDGHGGSLRALVRSGAVERLKEQGIDTISYFQVDNPLVHIIDPAFIGWHRLRKSEMSSKMVPKAYPEEKVGHFCTYQGNLVVVEYSDLPMELQKQTVPPTDNQEPEARLRFNSGSIAIHMLDLDFVEKVGSGKDAAFRLPFHKAHKKIEVVGEDGGSEKPEEPNGYKFEMFVFDALPFARNPVVIECSRADEFAPVKNAEGKDSPASCREAQLALFHSWLRAAEALPAENTENFPVEISPLFAPSEDVFMEKWEALEPKPTVQPNLYLE